MMNRFNKTAASLTDIRSKGKAAFLCTAAVTFAVFLECRASGSSSRTGVLYTTESDNITRLEYLDDEFKNIDETVFPYSGLGFNGYENECRTQDYLYLNPKGTVAERDAGVVLRLDMKDQSVSEYDFDRINVTSFTSDDEYIYAVSNLNNVCYLDRMCTADMELVSISTNDMILDSAAVIDGKMYSFQIDCDENYELCCVDFEKKEVEKIQTVTGDSPPCFLVPYGKDLLFTCGKGLLVYDTGSGLYREISLPHEDAYNLSVQGDTLTVGYTNIHGFDNGLIELYDLKDIEDVEELDSFCSFPFDGPIYQIERSYNSPDIIYVAGFFGMAQYKIEGDGAETVNTLEFAPGEDEIPGGMVLFEAGEETSETESEE